MLLLGGLTVRAVLANQAPRVGYPWDHFDNIGMGLNADREGLLKIYSVTRESLHPVVGNLLEDGASIRISRLNDTLPNYPPLGMTLFWLQYKVLDFLFSPLIANTISTRLITAVLPTFGDLLTAWGVYTLVMKLSNQNQTAVWAAVATWLAPPLMMNSTLWGQVDSLILAPSVWLVVFLGRREWVPAGLCLATAALLKPQGLILVPVAAFAALIATPRGAEPNILPKPTTMSERLWVKLCAGGIVFTTALAAITALALPWMIFDGVAWFHRCYLMSFFKAFPLTTLQGYNFWYGLALIGDLQPHAIDILDSHVRVAGLSKDGWGKLLFAVALVIVTFVAWRNNRTNPDMAMVIFAGLTLWSVFQWPTRVHERYIIYCIPFVIVMAATSHRYWPALLCLLAVASAEHCWNIWQPRGPTIGAYHHNIEEACEEILASYRADMDGVPVTQRPPPPSREETLKFLWRRHRAVRQLSENFERILTVMSLTAYGWAIAAAIWHPGASCKVFRFT